MVRDLLIRGMLAGVLAGLLAFGFGKVVGEPHIERAIAFEKQSSDDGHAAAHSHHGALQSHDEDALDPEPELVSRSIQASMGLFTGVIVYAIAFGGLFAIVFSYAYGRIGNLSPRATAAALACAAFVTIVLVPDIKYPPNPPAIGSAETIGPRTGLFLVIIMLSIAALVVASIVRRHLLPRLGAWNASIASGAVFVVLVIVVQFGLPNFDEVPEHFPADVLWRFRIASIGLEAILWTTIGLAFGAMAERLLVGKKAL